MIKEMGSRDNVAYFCYVNEVGNGKISATVV